MRAYLNRVAADRRCRGCLMLVLLVLLVCCYGIGFLCQWWGDPLAQSPVLDGRENLAWAQQIQADALPVEPFYRALLYPWLLGHLSVFFGLSGVVAACWGLLCHFLNAVLVFALADRLWRQRSAAWLAGVLYGLYPVSLWFSVQVLDITCGLNFFLLGMYALLRSREAKPLRWLLLAGLAAGLAVLARPNFLPPVLIFPLVSLALGVMDRRRLISALAYSGLVAVCVALPLLGQGSLNYSRSGEFRMLPWQGAYNLYAANRVGANGQFYKQRVAFEAVAEGQNTTRMESEYLYRESNESAGGDLEIDAMNGYWRAKLRQEVLADPVRWLDLMGRKVVYLFNDWEQYNNLTYAYHKERLTWLKWNPLGWGVLCLAAFSALWLGWRHVSKPDLLAVVLLMAAYAAGVLLFFVSARFRLPLAPLLAVLAGGLVLIRLECWRTWRRGPLLSFALCFVALSLLLYGNWWDARNPDTFIQDELLLANAAARSGDDLAALSYADAVLQRDASREEVRRIQVASLFNRCVASPDDSARWSALGQAIDAGAWSARMEVLRDPVLEFIWGAYAWRAGQHEAAQAVWRRSVAIHSPQLAASSALALEALAGVGGAGPQQMRELLGVVSQ
jgi:4-amino-4-deoxy-L-arabinose transferase-like glycosyltransferase